MKLIKKDISEKDGEGIVILIPEESEDMWHIYNLISSGDVLRASTFRKIVKTTSTGSTKSDKIRLSLSLEVERVDFDPSSCLIRIKGKNVEESEHVKNGAYHTIDLELNRKFQLHKYHWDTIFIERLEEACDVSKKADLVVVTMHTGLAHVCLVTNHMTITKAKIEQSIPRKRRGVTSQHDKAIKNFFEGIVQAILRHVNFDVVKCVLLASPGFVKDDFYIYMIDQAIRKDIKILTENKDKFVKSHSTSGHKHAIQECLMEPGIAARLSDTKASKEIAALEDFMKMFKNDSERAYYGFKHVVAAVEALAVDTLLVADSLFKANDIKTRKKYVEMVEKVRECGGKVFLFSSMHVSGEQLKQYSGVAAILRFPLHLEDDHIHDNTDGGGGLNNNSSDSESDEEEIPSIPIFPEDK